MKEYAILGIISVFAAIFLDWGLETNVLRRREFYVFLVIILGFKLLVNGYLTGNNIVMYNPHFLLGQRIGSIPIEDFLFGFSMVTLTIVFWQTFKERPARRRLFP